MTEQTLLILLWIGWCALHSLLISAPVNSWLQQQGAFLRGTFRLGYSLFAVISLLPMLWLEYSLPQKELFAWSGWLRLPQAVLWLYALLMLLGGMQVYDLGYLVGVRQWRCWQEGKTLPPLPFTCRGVLAYVRHPWYSAGLPILWTIGPITTANVPARSILSLYLLLGTVLEERKLRHELGAVYRSYCQQVPMLFPWKGRVAVQLPLHD